jgi:hypothetical protein
MRPTSVDTQKRTMDLPVTTDYLRKENTCNTYIVSSVNSGLGLSIPVSIFKTGFSVFKNCKTGIPVLKPVLKFLMNN